MELLKHVSFLMLCDKCNDGYESTWKLYKAMNPSISMQV